MRDSNPRPTRCKRDALTAAPIAPQVLPNASDYAAFPDRRKLKGKRTAPSRGRFTEPRRDHCGRPERGCPHPQHAESLTAAVHSTARCRPDALRVSNTRAPEEGFLRPLRFVWRWLGCGRGPGFAGPTEAGLFPGARRISLLSDLRLSCRPGGEEHVKANRNVGAPLNQVSSPGKK